MCGIAGFFFEQSIGATDAHDIYQSAAESLKNRGPDNSSYTLTADNRVLLIHARLAVIDLNEAANQPMTSECGRYHLVFNGEIYNYQVLRNELVAMGITLKTSSDTEILMCSLIHFGIDLALEKIRGMFAFALWDEAKKTLVIARDRAGEKPLYYTHQNGIFAFASDLKAFKKVKGLKLEIDQDALTSYLRFNYVPSPRSIFQNVFKLSPGSQLIFEGSNVELKTYWKLNPQDDLAESTPEQMIEEVEDLLKNIVSEQMLSDVPLGAFLSGGVDSSLIVSLMQQQSSRPVSTFSIGFTDPRYNEAHFAKDVASHLGTDHTELYVTPQDALNVIPKIPHIYTEPFADASQVPTFLVSQLARKNVTVSLTGDAGDELFSGYNRYQWGPKIWQKIDGVPLPLRQGLRRISSSVNVKTWDSFFKLLYKAIPQNRQIAVPAQKLKKIESIIDSPDPLALYMALISQWQNPNSVTTAGQELEYDYKRLWKNDRSIADNMAFCDFKGYMADDILVKVDRAAMAVSLETRAPFLDHRLIEKAFSIPQSLKFKDGQSKWLLRQILYKYVPKSLIERPKLGFGIPIDAWLRTDLKDWAMDLLSPGKLGRHGLFEQSVVEHCWQEHLQGRADNQYQLWGVLMFQAWYEMWNG